MKTVLLLFLLSALPAVAQSPDSLKYAPRAVLLLDATPGVEAVMPMVFTEGTQQRLEYVPGSKIKESMDMGGKPIRLADILAALNAATQRINQLQAENEKLWKVATKDSPQSQTVVVQQPTASQPSEAEIVAQQEEAQNARRQMALQLLLGMGQYQPAPNSTVNLRIRNCTRLPALCAVR